MLNAIKSSVGTIVTQLLQHEICYLLSLVYFRRIINLYCAAELIVSIFHSFKAGIADYLLKEDSFQN